MAPVPLLRMTTERCSRVTPKRKWDQSPVVRDTLVRGAGGFESHCSPFIQEAEMGLSVVTVASGGMPVVDVTPIASMTPIKYGLPVTEATNGYGVAVTLVTGKPGLPVIFVPLP